MSMINVNTVQTRRACKAFYSSAPLRFFAPLAEAFLLLLIFSLLSCSSNSVEATDAQYYVTVRVEPFIPTDLGDRVVEPATVYVDAPGARRVKVFLQPVDQPFGGKAIGKRKLIGVDNDPSDGFAVAWAADEPFDYVEIFGVAYGQPDVNRSRASPRVTILLDWRHRGNGTFTAQPDRSVPNFGF